MYVDRRGMAGNKRQKAGEEGSIKETSACQ